MTAIIKRIAACALGGLSLLAALHGDYAIAALALVGGWTLWR